VQEALANAAKHAAATHVTVHLCFRDAAVAVTIQDDGRGFDPVQSRRNWHALGLLGLEERISLLGGALQIYSQPGRGTQLALEIPTPSR
jgi:signal transduction histidine kinase